MSLLGEFKRRYVLRVAVAYLAGAWLLIQILETLFPIFGLEETSIRVVVIALSIGFIPALIAAWVFEFSAKGIVVDQGADRGADERPVRTTHKGFDRGIIAVLTLAVVYFAIDKFIIGGPAPLEKTIAVLPFENMSSDPEQEFFADGISEELLNLLTPVDGLTVISRTSSFQFKDSELSIPEIADQLGVGHILEGSVRLSGNTLRITAQLINASADAHLWSETYDRELKDIFAIQDEVSAKVVESLKITMDVGAPTAPRHNPEAYALYVKARQMMNVSSGEADLDRVEELLTKALDIDRDYLDAKVELSVVYGARGDRARREKNEELMQQQWDWSGKLQDEVAAVDPNNVSLNVLLAWENMLYPEVAGKYTARALSVDPHNVRALNAAVVILTRLWREDEAIRIAEYVIERDPLEWAHVPWNLARAYLNAGRFEDAEKLNRRMRDLSPNQETQRWLLGIGESLVLQNKSEEALEQFEGLPADDWLRLRVSSIALHSLGRHAEAAAALTAFIELPEERDWLYKQFFIATAYAWMGDTDQAFEHLYKQREVNPGLMRVMARSPFYRNLEQDPRWLPFLESVNSLAPDQREAVEFNPRLPPEIHAPN